MTTSFNFKIAGAAGEGIKKSGLIFSKTCFKHGLFVQGYTEYPSLIRGGRNTFQVHASSEPIFSPINKVDLLIDLQNEGDYPISKINKDAGGDSKTKNMAGLGIACFYFGLSLDILNQVIADTFAKKDKQIIALNHQVTTAGFKYAQTHLKNQAHPSIQPQSHQDQIFLTGNEAIALGAIAGGLKFYAAYPMTPATGILHFLASKSKAANITVRHAEDEIGVINMAIGASFAGARSMVATSGGGFSLMTEGLGLSGVTETPLVIVNSMRPGPASGMPTWSGQGDLLYIINASQDEFPRIVMAPANPEEAFNLSKLAQNMAEKYQLPVIILVDKYLSASYFTVKKFASAHQNQRHSFADTSQLDNHTPFPRYQDTQTGVSPRTIPGNQGGVHLCNSYEHDQLGYATEESKERVQQVDKRAKKITQILSDPDFVSPILYGPASAEITLISWGSNQGIILQAIKTLKNINLIHFPIVWPFPKTKFLQLIKNSKTLVSIEGNHNGQLAKLIRQETGVEIKNQLLKYDGRPFFPEEIIDYVQKNH